MLTFTAPLFRSLVRQADRARDGGEHRLAAALYEEALKLRPSHAGVLIQLGNMRKELGELVEAERRYQAALALRPEDADLLVQIAHLHKSAGDPVAAHRAYRRALALAPGWTVPADEIAFLERSGIRGDTAAPQDPFGFGMARADDPRLPGERTWAEVARLVPTLAPGHAVRAAAVRDRVELRQGGRRERGPWGVRRTLRGVEAIRGFFVTDAAPTEVGILLNGLLIRRETLGSPHRTAEEAPGKYVFNIWHDFSAYAGGLHQLELRVLGHADSIESAHDDVAIAPAIAEAAYPASDKLVTTSSSDPRPLEVQIRTRPNQVHQAERRLFPEGIRTILVMRPDQLGDLVASIPAVERLRELVPHARIVGLMNVANAALARTLAPFDEVIAIDFPDDRAEGRRLMSLDEQEELRSRLAPYRFDVAIDLAQADVSRELLPLAGACFTYGTWGGDWPWLSADFMMHTHDRWTGHDCTPHATKVLALVEAFGALLASTARVIRRGDLPRDCLTQYGVGPQDRFVVLHAGARIGFSRWPHHGRIAERVLRETDCKVVFMADDASYREALPPALLRDPRLVMLDRQLPFDHFDAFLSYASVMLGNDSGPKHLAALRGTPVVTLFSARINWAEWGQEGSGVIISRRVPCAGCALLHHPEECGKGFACVTDIEPEGVYREMRRFLDMDASLPARG